MDKYSNNGKRDFYEFIRTYDFKVEVPIIDDMGNCTNEVEIIEGEINFYSDIDWNSESEMYDVSYCWDESTGRFDNVIGSPPDKEDEFWHDLKKYLLSQGVNSSEIDW